MSLSDAQLELYGSGGFSSYLGNLDLLNRPEAYFVDGVWQVGSIPIHEEVFAKNALQYLVANLVQVVLTADELAQRSQLEAGVVIRKLARKGYKQCEDILAANPLIAQQRPDPFQKYPWLAKNLRYQRLQDPYSYEHHFRLKKLMAGIPLADRFSGLEQAA